MMRRKLIGKQKQIWFTPTEFFPFFFLIVTSFDYNASISQLVSLRPISATARSR